MATELVHARNTKRGTVGWVERSIFESKAFNPGVLIEVEHDAKPYIPELYKPRDADTFLKEKASKTPDPEPSAKVDTNTKDAD